MEFSKPFSENVLECINLLPFVSRHSHNLCHLRTIIGQYKTMELLEDVLCES